MNESYFYQALKQVVGSEPPEFMLSVTTEYYLHSMGDSDSQKLTEWASSKSNAPWFTGQGAVDAALSLVMDAVENGNITEIDHASDKLCLSGGKHSFHVFGGQKTRRCNNCLCLE
jgi:hypothetical protein